MGAVDRHRLKSVNEGGFTIVELLVVLVVIGILILVALPAFLGDQNNKAHDAEAKNYLGVSSHLSAALWRPNQSYPAFGNKLTKGSLLWDLQSNEPELVYGNVIANDPHWVQVNMVDEDRVTYIARSRSGTIFCLEVIERDVDGYKAGDYWSSGPESAWDPCGSEATTTGGPKGWDPDKPGLPDPPVVFNKDVDTRPFKGAGVLANGPITVGTNSSIDGGVQTNSYVQLEENAQVCGDAKVGEGQTVYTDGGVLSCDGTIFNGNFFFPAPQMAPVDNDNDLMWDTDTYTRKTDPFDTDTRVLSMISNSKVTLTGDTYVFCGIHMDSNSTLSFANTGDVTVYIDSPENCPEAPTEQLLMNSNTELEAPKIVAADGEGPRSVAFVFLGSAFEETTVRLDSNTLLDPDCTGTFVLYAPRTHLDMASNSTFCGNVAAKTVTMAANSTLQTSTSTWEVPTGAPEE